MKKISYLFVLTVLFMCVGCETDEIINNEQIEINQKLELETNQNDQLVNDGSTPQINSQELKSNPINPFNNEANEFPGGGDDSGGGDIGDEDDNGIIYNGTNFLSSRPLIYGETVYIEYASGTTETEKRELRLSYQVTGELLYYEQCNNNAQKELWYLSTSIVTAPLCGIVDCPSRSRNGLGGPTPSVSTIGIGTTIVLESNTQITINNVIVDASTTNFCFIY